MHYPARPRRWGATAPRRTHDPQEAIRSQLLASVRARLQSANAVFEAAYRDLLCDGGLRPLTQIIDGQRRDLADLIDLLEPLDPPTSAGG